MPNTNKMPPTDKDIKKAMPKIQLLAGYYSKYIFEGQKIQPLSLGHPFVQDMLAHYFTTKEHHERAKKCRSG